jgi:hypothetical protein
MEKMTTIRQQPNHISDFIIRQAYGAAGSGWVGFVGLGLGVKELREAAESGFVESHIDDNRVCRFSYSKGAAAFSEWMLAGAVVGSRGNHDDNNNDAKGVSEAISKPIHVSWIIIRIRTAAAHLQSRLPGIRRFVPTRYTNNNETPSGYPTLRPN